MKTGGIVGAKWGVGLTEPSKPWAQSPGVARTQGVASHPLRLMTLRWQVQKWPRSSCPFPLALSLPAPSGGPLPPSPWWVRPLLPPCGSGLAPPSAPLGAPPLLPRPLRAPPHSNSSAPGRLLQVSRPAGGALSPWPPGLLRSLGCSRTVCGPGGLAFTQTRRGGPG